MNNNHSRRKFIKRLAALGLSIPAISTAKQLQLINNTLGAAGINDFKTLVCVFLRGGNDSFNMVIPTDPTAYAAYSQSRGTLAVSIDGIPNPNASPLLFNPVMSELQALFNDNQLAVLANAGTLEEPVTSAQISAGTAQLPQDLFSHSHQQQCWEKAAGARNPANIPAGWGGSLANELLLDHPQNISSLISIDGYNDWQTGGESLAVSSSGGVTNINHITSSQWHDMIGASAQSPNIFEATLATRMSSTSSNSEALFDETQNTAYDSYFDNTGGLGNRLKMAARLIAGRENLNQHRQIFMVSMGGWDTHAEQNAVHPALLGQLSTALNAFNQAIVAMGKNDSVTTFTASDFGRTLTINGDGTDHGWGGHHLIMGGAVGGGQVYGAIPDFSIGGNDDFPDQSGRIIPTTADAQYAAVLARWMGLSQTQLDVIFPQLVNFDTAATGSSWDDGLLFMGS